MSEIVRMPKRRGEKAARIPADKIVPIDHTLVLYTEVERRWAARLQAALDAGTLDSGDVEALIAQMEATARNLDGLAEWLVNNWPGRAAQ